MAFALPHDRPALMGILNVTPDSFSDGGLHFDAEVAIEAGKRMMAVGADFIDVGGESTRPGSDGISEKEELRRVLPVVSVLAKSGIPVSIDTSKATVAESCLGSGAVVVNDVTALSDPRMATVCTESGCTVCLMHMQGNPRGMQQNPMYKDVVSEVAGFLQDRAAHAISTGIPAERIWIDPGIGFGKSIEHNLELLRSLSSFVQTGYPLLIGVSRKSFIGKLLGGEQTLPAGERLEGTLAAQAWAQVQGARIIRAHDVLASKRVIDMIAGITKAPK